GGAEERPGRDEDAVVLGEPLDVREELPASRQRDEPEEARLGRAPAGAGDGRDPLRREVALVADERLRALGERADRREGRDAERGVGGGEVRDRRDRGG